MNRFRRKSESKQRSRRASKDDGGRGAAASGEEAMAEEVPSLGRAGLPETADFRTSLILVRAASLSLVVGEGDGFSSLPGNSLAMGREGGRNAERPNDETDTTDRFGMRAQPNLMKRFSLLRGEDGQLVDLVTMQHHLACVSSLFPSSQKLTRSVSVAHNVRRAD